MKHGRAEPVDDIPWLDRLTHDLRGPLAPLQTASHLLGRDDLAPAQRTELLAIVDRQTRRMGSMLDEFADWSRIARHRLVGRREPCEPVLLLDNALSAHGLSGTAIDDDGTIAVVDGDPQRLDQLLRILVGYLAARGAPPALLRLRSADDCIRIELGAKARASDAALLEQLFEQPEPQPYDQGLGLQLLIAKAIVQAHAGRLWACIDDELLLLRCELPLAR